MNKSFIDTFVREHGPLLVADASGKPVINAKHAAYFYTNFGIPMETFQDWVNDLVASGKPMTPAV